MESTELHRLIDVVRIVADEQMLQKANSKEHAFNMIRSIIVRLPEPRVYVCEPFAKAIPNPIWDDGRDLLAEVLIQQDRSVIDPNEIRFITSWSTFFKLPPRNPLLFDLLRAKCISGIYLADEEYASEQRAELKKAAEKCSAILHLWKPEMVSIR